jgi:hypothetical protein
MILSESTFQVGLGSAAIIMLVGALSIGPVFAEDGGAGVGDGEGSHLSAPADGTHPPSEGKGANGEGARNGANNSTGEGHPSVPGVEGNDAIDTRISVQPRRPGGVRRKLGDVNPKTGLLFGAHLQPRGAFAPGVSHRFVRNAIGARFARHEGPEQDMGQPNFWNGMHGGAPGTINPAERAGGHWANRPMPNTGPIVKPGVFNGAAINGSTVKRPGVGTARIGGANANTAGINGTSIRPKR